MPYLTDVLQWDELEDFQRRMEKYPERYEEPEPDEDNEEDYPSIGWRENSVTVKNINGNINCSNDE